MSERRVSPHPGRVEPAASPSPASRYAFGDFSIDLRTRKLSRGSNVIPLPARAFDTLAYLIAHPGQPIDKNEIIAAAWRDVAVTDDSLIHAMSVLRRALVDDASRPSFIETIPRFGYRFLRGVDPVADAARMPTEPTTEPEHPPATFGRPAPRLMSRWREALAIACALVGIAAALAFWLVGDQRELGSGDDRHPGAVVRLHQVAPPGTSILSGGVVSPDGTHLAFMVREDASGQTALWVRTLRSSEVVKLAGTSGASKPFWSPDGQFLAFFAQDKLMAVGLSGEPPRTIATVGSTAAGGTWGSRGVIVFADWTRGLNAVPADGGPVATLRKLDQGAREFVIAWPRFLPDGRRFLYQLVSLDASRTGVYLGAVDSPQSHRLLDVTSPAVYSPPGFLLYVRHDMLMAEGFDASRLILDGRPVVLARGVPVPSWQDADVISGSRDVLAFREGDVRQRLRLVDRAGVEQGTLDIPSPFVNFRLSASQRLLLATGDAGYGPALWMVDLDRRQHTRLESEAIGPVWAPDNDRIAFAARGGFDLCVRSTTDAGPTPLVTDGFVKVPNDWSPDGKEIVYSQLDPDTKLDLWSLPVSGGSARPLLKTRFNETQARFSPDGRWIAYLSDESGTPEVYIRRYPKLENARRISIGGGSQPQWRRDQSELFYLSPDNAVMAVPVTFAGGTSFGAPRRLFRMSVAGSPWDIRDSYAAMADGQSFLLEAPPDVSQTSRISVMVNWTAGLQRLAAPHAGVVARVAAWPD